MKKLFLLLAAIVTLALSAQAQNHTYRGTVLSSADDEPLAGASVKPVGGSASAGVMTNVDGVFTITLPASVQQITVSYVGMKPVTVNLSDDMKIFLDNDTKVLDQVVVTGYGSGKKLGSVVGSVSVVNSGVIEKTPASNFIDALQGQVSGLAINSNSGDPSSSNTSIILRGRNSLSQDVTPLFICDGAPIDESFFTTMNPADIESVTVLKDAASIAIYGSRGANGIIVITTKKGKFGGNAKATIRANYGWSQMVADNVEMMNSEQYLYFRNNLVGQPLSSEVANLIQTYGISTNWRDELFNSSAPTYSLEGSVTGGSDNVNYYVSLGHYSMDGIIENSEMNRQTLSWSLDAKINNWFRVGFSGNTGFRRWKTNYSSDNFVTDEGLDVGNPTMMARLALPYETARAYSFNENGDLVWGGPTEQLRYLGWTLPWWTYTIRHWKNTELMGNMRLYEMINPVKGLTIKAQQAMEGSDTRSSVVYDPYKSFNTAFGRKVGSAALGEINPGSNNESFSRYYQFTYTNTAEYKFEFNKVHTGSILVGQESIIQRSEGFGVSTVGTTDVRMKLLDQGNFTDINRVSYSKGEIVINSFFLNGNYGYDDRYFVDFSVRRDGSSRFAPDHRWSTFGAIGLMWNMKNEKFLKEKTWLNDLRLHYSYGATGNSNVGNFAWQGMVGNGSNYNGESSIILSGASNNDLSWETVYSHDLGVNFRVFDRLSVTADWYYKRTENMLYSIPFSLITGVSSGMYNACSMTNKGIEVEVQGDIFKNNDWYVGARVQFNYNKNQISELWDGNEEFVEANTGLIQKVGDVMSQYYLVRYVGVDPADGKQVWLDKNDNPTKVFPSDAYVCTGKSAYAPWIGGFGLNARWKGLSASVNFAFQSGKYMINNDRYFITNPTEFAAYNQTVDALNMWTTPGQVTDVPAYGESLHLGEDTSWLEDASFTRLKNLTVAYDFPTALVNKWGLKGLQLHFTGRNLWTITNFSGYDPEVQSNMVQFQYPNTRQYEFGIEVSF